MKNRSAIVGAVSVAVLVLTSCGLVDTPRRSSSVRSEGFPMTAQNCGQDVTFNSRPTHVAALGPSQVTTVYAAGGSRMLIGRDDAGKRSDPYPADMKSAMADVPQLGLGGGEVTRENLVDLGTDLVVGSVSESISPQSLSAVGIPMLSLRGDCGSNHAPGRGDGTADFDDVFFDVEQLGRLLGTGGYATASVADMRDRIARAKASTELHGSKIAVVIVFGNRFEAYGMRSMAHTQLNELGAVNVFGDVDGRAFDTSVEQLAARDPDHIVILSYGESDEAARNAFVRMPGASELTAVRDDAILVQPYEYSSQGVLSVNGLENLAVRLKAPRVGR